MNLTLEAWIINPQNQKQKSKLSHPVYPASNSPGQWEQESQGIHKHSPVGRGIKNEEQAWHLQICLSHPPAQGILSFSLNVNKAGIPSPTAWMRKERPIACSGQNQEAWPASDWHGMNIHPEAEETERERKELGGRENSMPVIKTKTWCKI